MTNPFSTAFGVEPTSYIYRIKEEGEIIDDFSSEKPSNYVYILTGARGSGKTVFMYSIANKLAEKKDWIVAYIGPKINILETLAAQIYEQSKMKYLFLNKEFSFSFQGLSLSLSGKEPVSDVMILLSKMLTRLKKKNIKVLVAIDDVNNSEEMKYFIEGYASLLGQKCPIRLIMTGINSNISKLQNEETLTFLHRAQRIQISSLPFGPIASNYANILKIDYDSALELAKFTKGYAYAYQLLGSILYKNKKNKIDNDVLLIFDQYLSEYVYEIIYSGLNATSQKILQTIKEDRPVKLAELVKKLNKPNSFISVYRDNLIKEGVLYSPAYGYIQFALPRFDIYLKMKN